MADINDLMFISTYGQYRAGDSAYPQIAGKCAAVALSQ